MRKFKDDRNRAYNDVFPQIGTGDVNVSVLYPGTIKAFHRHQKQDDYWFIAKGNIRAVLVKEVLQPQTFHSKPIMGNPGWHSVKLPGVHSENAATSNGPFSISQSVYVPEVSVHYLTEGDLLHIPANVWHGLQVLGNEDAIMIYHITNKYSEISPDEERTAWDEFYDWEISRK